MVWRAGTITIIDAARAIASRRRLAAAVLLACVAALGCAGGCVPPADGPADSFGIDFSLPDGAETCGAVVFLVDGVHAGIFRQMLDAGELPAIQKYFVDRGLYCPRAVASTPSVTLANLTSVITGRLPGHHGVVGINWFDRHTFVWRDYETIAQKNALDGDYSVPNLFEQFPDRMTVSLFYQPHRGTTKFFENWASAGPPFFFGWYEYVDRLSLYRFGEMMAAARERKEFPAVAVCYLLAPDFRAYGYGVSSPEYRQALRHTDRQLGRVLGDMDRSGLLDRLVVALVSDHSLTDVGKHFHVGDFLRDRVGLGVAPHRLWESTPFERRQEAYGRFECVVYGSGDRYTAVHLRRPVLRADGGVVFASWNLRPTMADLRAYPVVSAARPVRRVDLPAELVRQEGVDVVAYRAGPDAVRVLRKTGEVEFRAQGQAISYRAISGDDPLGWKGRVPGEALRGKALGGREWLAVTVGTEYPDLPEQIVAYFRAPRAGDIAVFASAGWDLNRVHQAGHGGLGPEDLLVPLLLAGPGVPRGSTREPARTVDLVPTILKLLDRPIPPGLDGKPILP